MSFELNWSRIEKRVAELSNALLSSEIDYSKRAEIQKEFTRLDNLLKEHKLLEKIEKQKNVLLKQQEENEDPDLDELFKEELEELKGKESKQIRKLENALFPPDEKDNRSVFLEIRAGAGGQEASLFVSDLARMYMMYAAKMGWRAIVIDESPTEVGGFREIILHIKGKNAYGHLKFEAGVHRVQRVPKTESSGRVHTSTVTVAVLPEAPESDKEMGDIVINPSDLRVDVYRSSGAGGQHVNKTDSAVRLTHLPTGIVVACQEDRSQHKNKATAMKMLKSKLLVREQEKHEKKVSEARKSQVGTGMRAEKVRTYNYPQNRVSDHQVDLTLNKLDIIMDGNLEEIIQALKEKEIQKKRSQGVSLNF